MARFDPTGRSRSGRPGCGLAAALLLVGCHVPPAPTLPTPTARGPAATVARSALRGSIAAAVLTAALRAELADAHAEVRHDPTLARVAEAAAWSVLSDEVISEAAVHNAMVTTLRSGVTPHVLTAWLRREDRSASADLTRRRLSEAEVAQLYHALVTAMQELIAEIPLDSFAVSVRMGPAGVVAAIAALEPPRVPLRIERHGGRALVSAPWQRGAPAAFLITPQGTERLAATVVAATLQIEVPCRRGLADLEVAEASVPAAAQGEALVASVVDVCGAAEPRWATATGDFGPRATSQIELEQRAFELLNRERARAGLGAVGWDAPALAMARAHSRDMAAHHFVEHVGSDGGTVEQRLARVHLPAVRTFENVGRAGGPAEMHQGFLTSPGHRANMLEPSARRAAVGVALDPATGEVYYTQVLYEPAHQLRALQAAKIAAIAQPGLTEVAPPSRPTLPR